MGLVDKSKRTTPLAAGPSPMPREAISYALAYKVLPFYVYKQFEKLTEIVQGAPSVSGSFFYGMACRMLNAEPSLADAQRYRWHSGHLGEAAAYSLLEYPAPAPLHFEEAELMRLVEAGSKFVLAPYFSVVVRRQTSGATECYVLGQSPLGATTFRTIRGDGGNFNLGPGCEPTPAAFLALVSDHLTRPRVAVAGIAPGGSRDAR